MSLKAFHVVFVTTAVLLAIGFGAWAFQFPAYFFVGVLAWLFGLGFALYGVQFYRRFWGKKAVSSGLTAGVLILAAKSALACSVCFGNGDSLQAQGMRSAIFVLLGIVMVMWIFFGAFFYRLWRSAKGDLRS